ncbi:CcmD family protein [Pedobacter puniceum]|jgi:CcmD family protein|uniref:CcmD family protein n=1 Tax=Pedobacter puniceum TaxID=2666136 RepID=A0A7K0FQG7_9SPHI|nr:CcmD family protein [Pedobacter puniceum]MRX48196.1 CcmD family protein [Pedobacter puniceum]
MKRFFSLIAILFLVVQFAQAQSVEMADALRSSGKIYVVVAVMAVLFIGLFFYLFSIDRRLKKIEKDK